MKRNHEEDTAEECARREEEESIALAQRLVADEAMASLDMGNDFLAPDCDLVSPEDLVAIQLALEDEDDDDPGSTADQPLPRPPQASEPRRSCSLCGFAFRTNYTGNFPTCDDCQEQQAKAQDQGHDQE